MCIYQRNVAQQSVLAPIIRRVEDCRKKAMECHHRAFTCQDHAIRVLYLDLVYQWRQIADEFEVLERAKLKGVDERA